MIPPNSSPARLPSRAAMYRAFLRRDPSYEGVFFAGVKTTGIFCRPTCRARKPREANVEFFPSASAASGCGYRPCLLCRPMEASAGVPEVVGRLLSLVEADPVGRVTDKELAAQGVDPSTARRRFRACFGMTFQAYQRARRLGNALRGVSDGRAVIEAQLDGGYDSASGFRGAFRRLFGKPPRGARVDDCLLALRIDTPLGPMLALADRQGLRMLDFADRRGLKAAVGRLQRRLGCAVVPGESPVLEAAGRQLRSYFSGASAAFDLPLAPVGSTFQLRVWKELGAIPPGATRSYAEIARAVGRPGAQRAVGRANGSNVLAIVIPCHRVIRSDGSLSGYGGGVWRKQRLLDLERAQEPPVSARL